MWYNDGVGDDKRPFDRGYRIMRYRKTFYSEGRAMAFAHQLGDQGISATVSSERDAINRDTIYIIEWMIN